MLPKHDFVWNSTTENFPKAIDRLDQIQLLTVTNRLAKVYKTRKIPKNDDLLTHFRQIESDPSRIFWIGSKTTKKNWLCKFAASTVHYAYMPPSIQTTLNFYSRSIIAFFTQLQSNKNTWIEFLLKYIGTYIDLTFNTSLQIISLIYDLIVSCLT